MQRAVTRDIFRKAALVVLVSAALWAALITIASAEAIRSFDSDILVHEDSSFTVTETIVYDFEQELRHGIFRNIKDKHPQEASAWYKTRYIDLELISVTRDGQSEPYTLEPYDGLSVKIGDPYSTIIGQHVYQIKYLVRGGLAEYPEGVELYWNATGDEWPVTIESAIALVRVSYGVEMLSDRDCYVGLHGSAERCDSIETQTDGIVFNEQRIFPGQGFTIAQSLDLPVSPQILERTDMTWLWVVLFAVWFSGLGVWIYRWRTAHRPSQTIIPQYEPLPEFKPMFTGILFDNRLDTRDITACIVYLAQQGFISIKQTTDKVAWLFDATDYEVTLLRPSEEVETEFQRQVLTLIFGPFTGVGVTKKLSDIKSDEAQRRKNSATIQVLRKTVIMELVKQGLLEQTISRTARISIGVALVFVGQYFLPMVMLFGPFTIAFIFGTVLTILILLIAGFERRTRKGYEALNYLKGFKDFLSVTEKERYKFHNAPALSPQQFMEYLPYAIAFGVEEEWAEVFKDIQIGQPDWYSSTSGSTFNAVAFTGSIGAFSTAFASSSGSSGSRGGGHSGGGGGGGGGGSW
ncbi:MAG: DUF2207 domain-containing protein [Candidatus Pacebacteria bacterium]|nr:DUF2207 domain-containing protein [Candidatus Paceibacterota bacterium]